ncbi:uncharacterized protein LOC143847052 [Tasmannia lanceolata]|uniref:uncharacterized protein LOC143847052 n=1 Tax=Tasmannia lanceolata TaxID=3420 RepID=UPI00406426F8
MERAGKVLDLFGKRENMIHLFLGGAFVALSVRSMSQQNEIQALEAEKETLSKRNKAMKKAMWDWKQQLFREESENSSFPVPLSKLKSIYGDIISTTQQGVAGETVDSSSAKPKLVI